MQPDRDIFHRDGALLIERAVSARRLEILTALSDADGLTGPGRRMTCPNEALTGEIVRPDGLTDLASKLEGERLRPVRVLLFDKTPASNWSVGWHQDRVLPLARKLVRPGYERWTVKAGVPHVEPPADLSARMITLRIHLDDASANNAPLKVIEGSHRSGRLTDTDVKHLCAAAPARTITACAGDVLALKTLIVHASERATCRSRRRVLHIDFAPPDALPEGLSWVFSTDPSE